jgi:hypothetical protein
MGVVGAWGVATLSEYQSLALKGKVIKLGPYRYTRNQRAHCVGFLVGCGVYSYICVGICFC